MRSAGRALFAMPCLVAIAARLLTGPHPIDDAYITFRYARNLAEGVGLVYNSGEWVLGTTTPLWAIILGAGYRLGLTDLAWLATVLSAVCDGASAVLLALFARHMGWGPLGAALVGIAWALNPMSIAFASGGMETSLFVLLTLVALSLTARGLLQRRSGPAEGGVLQRRSGLAEGTVLQRPPGPAEGATAFDARQVTLAAALAGLATLVRPEGALLAVVVVACAWLSIASLHIGGGSGLRGAAAMARTWTACARQAAPVLAAAVAPMCLAGLLLAARYGSPLPHSLAAKQVAYLPAWPLENAAALLLQAGLPGWSTYLLAVLPSAAGLLLALFGLLALVELARRGVKHLDTAWLPFAAFAALYVGFYVVVGLRGVRLFPWYLVPIEPFYLLALAAGLRALTADVARLRSWAWVAPAALAAWQLAAIDWHQPLLPAGEDLAREQLYVSVGHDLAELLPPEAVVAAPEIGALGYASGLRMLDTVGLVSPTALPYYPLPADQIVGDNAIPPRMIDELQPDAVVTLDGFARRSLLLDPAFETEYRLEARYPARVWQSQELLVYRRIPPDDAAAAAVSKVTP